MWMRLCSSQLISLKSNHFITGDRSSSLWAHCLYPFMTNSRHSSRLGQLPWFYYVIYTWIRLLHFSTNIYNKPLWISIKKIKSRGQSKTKNRARGDGLEGVKDFLCMYRDLDFYPGHPCKEARHDDVPVSPWWRAEKGGLWILAV